MNTDIDKLIREVDLRQLEQLLQNITYASLDREDMDRFGDDNFIKLFKLSQMSIEYLVYTQNYLECLTRTLDIQYKNSIAQTQGVRDQIQKYNTQIQNLKKENQKKQKVLSTYEYLMKVPKDGAGAQAAGAMKCNHCSKFFESETFLKKHYQKKHPQQDFDGEFPSPVQVQKQQEEAQKQL